MKLLVPLEPLDIDSRIIDSDLGFEKNVFVWLGEDVLDILKNFDGLDDLYNKVLMMSNGNPFVHF